ncbi:MAG: hypothetical protein J6X80_10015 [Lachnospiraceae bacterium]|nr:hypothetical protein [Lachnospiraceae bacterium]
MEKDLFEPIKEYFSALGYSCDGEVNDIDLYMQKDGEDIAVELKQTLDFKAVRQAALRQKIVDTVYIGTFMPKNLHSRENKEKIYLLKRLGIGLIVVSKRTGTVQTVSEPVVSELVSFKVRNKKKKAALKKEFTKRKVKSNVGGVTGTKLMTGYREDALLVLDSLKELGGEASPRAVKAICNVEKTPNILRDNHYGWFVHADKGLYALSDKGSEALKEYADSIKILRENEAKNNQI